MNQSATSAVRVWTSIPEKLPCVPHFADHIEIEIGNDERVFIARRLRDKLPARIAEVTLSVKLADVPRLFVTDAIDRADEISIRDSVRRLFESPEIFESPATVAEGLKTISAPFAERSRTLGEVAVVTDVHADARERRIETRITKIAGTEIKLLPETGIDVRNVVLAILAEILPISIDYAAVL